MTPEILTYRDAYVSLRDFVGSANPSLRFGGFLRAIESAYRKIEQAHKWNCLTRHGRITLDAKQDFTELTYDHTGGTYERQLTSSASGETFPTDARYWRVRIGDRVSEIEDYKTPTVVTLDRQLNYGEDISTATAGTLERVTYPLPLDFLSLEGVAGESAWQLASYLPPNEFMRLERYRQSSGDIVHYTIIGSPDNYGNSTLWIWPPASDTQTVDFIYRRRGRPLRYTGLNEDVDHKGTVSTSGATVTGSSTAFASAMVGSIIRFGTDSSNVPGNQGSAVYPCAEERSIISYTSTTSITVDASLGTDVSGVKYVISDPIDLDPILHNAFFRCCESIIGTQNNYDNKRELYAMYREALREAQSADCRSYERRLVGEGYPIRKRIADLPLIDDVTS